MPSFEICDVPSVVVRAVDAATPRPAATASNTVAMPAGTASSSRRPAAWKTIWPSAPARAGKRSGEEVLARCDSVPDSEKLCENFRRRRCRGS